MRRVITFEGGQRAVEDPAENLQSNPFVTSLVLGRGFNRIYPGARMWPRFNADWKFQYTRFGTESMRLRDTERPMRAPYKVDGFQPSYEDSSLKRYSWATMRDKDEFRISTPNLNLQVNCGVYSRRITEQDIERVRREAILTDANYPAGHVVTLGAGDEFNAATGDARPFIQAAAEIIALKLGVEWSQLSLFMPHTAFAAAINDPTFLAAWFLNSTTVPTEADLAKYYGIGEVWTANPVHFTDAGVATYSWPDTSVLYFTGDPQMDTSFGEPAWGRTFAWNQGGISSSMISIDWPETANAFPWTDYARPLMLTSEAAVLIKNCSTTV